MSEIETKPAEGDNPPAPEQTEPTPVWDRVPEKFRRETPEETVEALLTGYSSIEKEWSKRQSLDIKPGDAPPAEPPVYDDIESIIEASGLDRDELVKTYTEKGAFTDEQYEAFRTKARLGKAAVDRIAGREVEEAKRYQESITQAAVEAAGGPSELEELKRFAAEHLSSDELESYNALLDNITPSKARDAVALLKAKRDAKGGGKARAPVSGSVPPPSGGGAKNATELREAIRKVQRPDLTDDERGRLYRFISETPASIKQEIR